MFGQKRQEKREKNNKVKLLRTMAVICSAIACILGFCRAKKGQIYFTGQKKEFNELASGKENFKTFRRDSKRLIKDLFIPSDSNDNKPKLLRPKTIVFYIILAIVIKIAVTGFLFASYPSPAKLAAIVADRMVAMVNQSRVQNDTDVLEINTHLVAAAQKKAQNMIDEQYFAHNAPDGKRPWEWIDKGAYDYVFAGENLAMDFSEAEPLHEAFMKSPSHRKNILKPQYKEIGVAVVTGQMQGRETILLVEMFGTQRNKGAELAIAIPPVEIIKPPEEKPAPKVAVEPRVPTPVLGEETVVSPEVPAEKPIEKPIPKAEPKAAEPTPVVSDEEDQLVKEAAPIEDNEKTEKLYAPAGGVINVSVGATTTRTITETIIEYSNIFFIAFLVFIVIMFILNVVINIRVQHKGVIVQTVVVIALLVAMILVKFHYVEKISDQLLIL